MVAKSPTGGVPASYWEEDHIRPAVGAVDDLRLGVEAEVSEADRHRFDAVTAGLTTDWNSGPVEGTVRMIKRQVFGRADAFTVCAVEAAASAVVALGLVPRGKPQSTGGPHVH